MSLRKLLAAIMVVSMVLGLVGTSALAAESEQWDNATVLLQQFGIVKGDASGDLRLNDTITRAEMVKVLVAAAGAEELANLLKGAPSYTDVAADAWYSGYVAFAKNAGIAGGYADGTFRPEAQVTYAEVVAFLAKFLGIEPVAGAEWPNNYIQAFENAGLAAEGLNLAEFANAPAVRGWVFVLADNTFRYGGAESVYAYLDGEPPVLSVDPVAPTTEATKVTVSGKVAGAESLFVNDAAVEFGADGSFSAEVALAVGANSIVIAAVDTVGLEATEVVEVTRSLTPAAAIEAEALTVEAGATVDYTVVVKDANGEVIADAAVEGESELGTYADGKFVAGEKAGTGTLTLKAGDVEKSVAVTVTPAALAKLEVTPSAANVAPGDKVTFTVKGFDAHGNEVSGIAPVFSDDSADALTDGATGDFIASKAGTYTVTAAVGEVKGSATVGVYGDVAKFEVTGPETLVGNEETAAVFTVRALDEFGNLVKVDGTVALSVTAGDIVNESDDNDDDSLEIEDGVGTFELTASLTEWGTILTVTANPDDGDFTADIENATATIEIVEQVATSLKVEPAGKYMAANDGTDSHDFTVTVLDQEGEPMLSGSGAWDYSWTVTGPATVTVGSSEETEGEDVITAGVDEEITVNSQKGKTGTVTVTVSIDGLGSASGSVTAAIAGNPAKLALELNKEEITADNGVAATDSYVTITLTATDANGVPVTYDPADTDDVVLTFDGGVIGAVDAGTPSDADGDGDNETLTIDWNDAGASSATVKVALTKAGTVNVTAETEAGDLEKAAASLKVNPAAVADAQIVDLPSLAVILPVNAPKASYTIQLYDAFGNEVAKAGQKVHVIGFIDAGGTVDAYDAGEETAEVTINGEAADEAVEVKTDANGQASIEVETRPYTDKCGVEIVAGGDVGPGIDKTVLFDVEAAVATTMTVSLRNAGDTADVTSIVAGTPVLVKVTVKDQYKAGMTGIGAYLKLDVEDYEWDDDATAKAGQKASVIEALSFNDDGSGVYTRTLYPAKSGRLVVKVNFTGSTLAANDSVGVKAGNDAFAVVAEADTTVAAGGEVELKEDTLQAFTLRIADEWGVLKSGTQTYDVNFEFDDTNVVIRTKTDGVDLVPATDTNELATGTTVSLRTSKTIYVLADDLTADETVTINLIDRDVNNDGVTGDEAVVGSWTLTITKAD